MSSDRPNPCEIDRLLVVLAEALRQADRCDFAVAAHIAAALSLAERLASRDDQSSRR